MSLNNLSIGKKLTIAFLFLSVITLIVGGFGIYGTHDITDDLRYLGSNRIPDLKNLAELNYERIIIRAQTYEILMSQTQNDRQAVLERIKIERENSWKKIEDVMARLVAIPRASETGGQLLSRLQGHYQSWRDSYRELDSTMIRIIQAQTEDDRKARYADFRSIMTRIIPISNSMGQTCEEMTKNNTTNTLNMIDRNVTDGQNIVRTCVVVMLIGVAVSIFFGFLSVRKITAPLNTVVAYTEHLTQGNYTEEIPETLRLQKDEIGDLARAFHLMVESTRDLLKNMIAGIQTVAASATELSAISAQTVQNVQTMSDKTSTVAAAAEESSANTTSVAASMEEAATNLSSVAGATEEMSATIGEIAANSERARVISSDAGAQSAAVSVLMKQLGDAAMEIGKVTETITNISSQTNLLALNATIEAARAGAAGKGFAVVANEIKELARQTATATEDIKARIGGVQSSAGSAISDTGAISGIISEVSHIVSNIATAIEEQSAVTRDVAGNIAQASAGVQEANERVAQTANVSKNIAQDMAEVDAATAQIRSAGQQVQNSALELSKLAEDLKRLVGRFKV